MRLFDLNDPIYKPLWIRLAIIVVTGSWGLFEFIGGSLFWGALFSGVCAVAVYSFFIANNPHDSDDETGSQ